MSSLRSIKKIVKTQIKLSNKLLPYDLKIVYFI